MRHLKMSHSDCAMVWRFQPRVHHLNVALTTVHRLYNIRSYCISYQTTWCSGCPESKAGVHAMRAVVDPVSTVTLYGPCRPTSVHTCRRRPTTLRHTSTLVRFYRAMLCIRGTSHGAVSVCLSQVGVPSKRMNESSWFLACELPSTRPTLC